MKKERTQRAKKELPLYDLQAFSDKATWVDFYIQRLQDHIRAHEFVGKPHKHDFYLILFIQEGAGKHTIDFYTYPVTSNSLFLMTPGQVHTWDISPETKGVIVFFTKEFYQMHLSENSLLEFPFFHSLNASPLVRLEKTGAISFLIEQMLKEYEASPKPDLRLLRAYLDVFLLEASSQYDLSKTVKTRANTFKLRKLEHLIEENFKTVKQPSDYADMMNLAPTYLNSICKESLGKTLSELIQERVMLEAKRLFAYSDLNVNEVAARLAFSDTSYFVRWFKKGCGLTPEEFRKSQLFAG